MGAAICIIHRRYTVFIRLAILGAGLLGLCGCSTLQIWLGTRIKLEKTQVASIRAYLPQGKAMYPGQQAPMVVRATTPNGKVFFTEGAAKGKILWEDLHLDPNIVSVTPKGARGGGATTLFHGNRTAPGRPVLRSQRPLHQELRLPGAAAQLCSGSDSFVADRSS